MVVLTFSGCFCILGLQESKFLKFLGFMWNPLSWVMEAAAIMAIALANGGVSILFFFFSTKDFSVTAQKDEGRKEVELSMLILMFLWFLRN